MDDSDIDTVFNNIYSGDDSSNIVSSIYSIYSGWWFQPLWKILVNGKADPIYYGK